MFTLTPAIGGMIERRLLVNFRIQPAMVRPWLPAIFRPKLVQGWAVAGICLIRLKSMRPPGFPSWVGLDSENAAHRIAVEWDDHGQSREGVYIPRRDTSSRLQALAGGRWFPGLSHRADFAVKETANTCQLQMQSRDHAVQLDVHARRAAQMPAGSIFSSLEEASAFFARGSTGYSATKNPDRCDGLELQVRNWQVEALEVLSVHSSFFDDPRRFPPGTIQFDNALLMRNIEHTWQVLPPQRTRED